MRYKLPLFSALFFRELEKIAPSKWPSIGVQYAEILLQMIRNPQSLVASEMKAYFWHSSTLNSPVSKLIKIIKTLKEINDLFQHYNIHISTTEYYHVSVLFFPPLISECIFSVSLEYTVAFSLDLQTCVQSRSTLKKGLGSYHPIESQKYRGMRVDSLLTGSEKI